MKTVPGRIARRRFLACSAAAPAALALRFPAGAAEFTYKLGSDKQPTQPTAIRLVEAAEKIKQDSGGRLEIRVFLNGALGNQAQSISQVRLGAMEMLAPADDVFASTVPAAGMTGLPFIVSDRQGALKILTGDFGAYVRGEIAKVGLYQFNGSWDSGFRQMLNSLRPIVVPGDMKGMKMRVPDSPVNVALFKALGSIPTAITANEMYSAMQTHLVDGTSLPLISVEAFKIYEVQKYVSYTNHLWGADSVVANTDAWNRLPKNLRDIVERNIEAARNASNEDNGKLNVTVEGRLKAQGLAFNNADIPAFRKVVRDSGLYTQWKTTYGTVAWTALEKSVGSLS